MGEIRREREIQREQRAALRRSIIIYQTPAAPPPPPPPPPGQCAREKERQLESERVTLTSQWRGDVKRRIHAGGKKNPSLFPAASLRTSYGQRRAKEESGWRIPSLCFPAVSEAVPECGWSAGRAAAESSTSDLAPQQKTSSSEEPGCLTT